MIKVLIVDDEPNALKTMEYIVDWSRYGYQIAAQASGGQEALALLKKSKDIRLLITDIRMPLMDGIELIEQVRSFSDIPIVAMSGYNEFQYARTCLRYGVKDYLLKPVCEEDVIQLLQSIRQELEKQEQLDRHLRMGLPALHDKLLRRWVHGYLLQEEKEHVLELSGITDQDPLISVAVYEMDYQEYAHAEHTQSHIELMRFAVRNVLEEALNGQGYVFEDSDDRFGVMLFPPQNSDEEAMFQFALDVQDKVTRYTKVKITVGLGLCVIGLDSVPLSYRTAAHALEQKYIIGIHQVIRASAGMRKASSQDLTLFSQSEVIREELRSGRTEAVSIRLRALCSQMAAQKTPKEIVRAVVLSVYASCYELALQGSEMVGPEPSMKEEWLEQLTRSKTIQELFADVELRCMQTMEQLDQRQGSQAKTTIEQVKRHVQEKFDTNLSLKEIAESLYMNATYLGQQFKSIEGMTFNDYLLQVRMEKAKELLKLTTLKVYEIANQVGYQELDWFYKRFKEYTGMSTTKYRMQQKKACHSMEVHKC